MKWLGDKAVFMDNDQFTDLCLMSWCNGHIIANSSFSWWGAYPGAEKLWLQKNGLDRRDRKTGKMFMKTTGFNYEKTTANFCNSNQN